MTNMTKIIQLFQCIAELSFIKLVIIFKVLINSNTLLSSWQKDQRLLKKTPL